jgi:energy-coupling factor transporter ATP-binding protein EcfA2
MDNPFSTKFWTPGAIPFLFDSGTDCDSLIQEMQEVQVCQIVGPHGSGKSTLLQTLKRRCEQRGISVRLAILTDKQRKLPPDFRQKKDDPKAFYFIDGLDQLSLWAQMTLYFRFNNFVFTRHRPLFRVPLLYRAEPRFETFVQLVSQLSPISIDESALRLIYSHAGGNFRNAFFELYDQLEEPLHK